MFQSYLCWFCESSLDFGAMCGSLNSIFLIQLWVQIFTGSYSHSQLLITRLGSWLHCIEIRVVYWVIGKLLTVTSRHQFCCCSQLWVRKGCFTYHPSFSHKNLIAISIFILNFTTAFLLCLRDFWDLQALHWVFVLITLPYRADE